MTKYHDIITRLVDIFIHMLHLVTAAGLLGIEYTVKSLI